MILEQPALRSLLAEGVLARGYTADDLPALAGGGPADGDGGGETSALVILSRFALDGFVRGTAEFVARLDAETRATWYRDFTRTRFLVGDSTRIAMRYEEALIHRTADAAWVSPATPPKTLLTLRRLLKPLRTNRAHGVPHPSSCALDEHGGSPLRAVKEIHLATHGLRLEDYLITLNHTLCEGLITASLSRGDTIVVREVPSIRRLPGRYEYVRIVPDPWRKGALRAMSYICAS